MIQKGKCIYGFISARGPENLGPIGLDGEEVCIEPYRDVAAVVSDVSVEAFVSVSREKLLRYLAVYQSVIERVMEDRSVIPMKFGTVVHGEDDFRRILEKGYEQINRNVRVMEDRIEIDVVALWHDMEKVFGKIAEDEDVKRCREDAASMGSGEAGDIRVRVGKTVKTVLDRTRREYADLLLDVLKKEAKSHCCHDIMDDSMIMNAAFLIMRGGEELFEKKVRDLNTRHRGDIDFRIIGPLPPYSFSTLWVQRFSFAEIDRARNVLGLGDLATLMEIGEAFRQMTGKYHPDKFPGDRAVQKRFERINEAYGVLGDYCLSGTCSFGKADVEDRIRVRILERPGLFS